MNTKELIHLIIDTSILRAEPYYKKEEYKSLEILVSKGILKIYLPYIVENEYVEQLKESYLKKFSSIKDSLKDLKEKYLTNTDEVASIEESLASMESNTVKNIIEDFETNFCTKLGIEKLYIEPHHAKEVFSKYFKGVTPFKNKKSRDDIPDSFIFECVKDIKNKESNTVVIVGDGEFSNACKRINTTIFKSLKDFIKNDEIQNILTEQNFSNFIDYIKSNNMIENFLECYHVKELENITIENHQIPSEDNSAQVTDLSTPKNIKCDFINLVYYGNQRVGIPIIFDIEVNVDLFMLKSDYYMKDYAFSSPEDWNDHYYIVEGEYLLNVKSTVIIDMSEIDFSISDIDFDEITMSINDIGDIEVVQKIVKT
ncbi:PIN domain-containing protein [Aliarcobacter butzleri]|uniref:PIN domain-containing protein n=1 Tax=Aliarcobacter butzleri TaxID=28197 RepID=UPI00263F4005|nr:PIN domain-containing protein [Aliarcobacter butzleri]MDN5087101.1 PIN domain-containing protein [Aliarcobacter butzleri]